MSVLQMNCVKGAESIFFFFSALSFKFVSLIHSKK